jgi:hypothetical protein
VAPSRRLVPQPPTWLLVFCGDADWPALVADPIAGAAAGDEEAHHILSREVEGERWSLLLVHSEAERDAVLRRLAAQWEHVFVNEVWDLADERPAAS